MIRGYLRLCNAIDDTPALGGGPGRESETPAQVGRASERMAFEASRRRNLGDPALAPEERIGDISRAIEEHSVAHTPRYPERHVAGGPYVGMAPGIPTRYDRWPERQGRFGRAAGYAGRGAGTVARWAGNLKNVRDMRTADARANAERFVIEHPYAIGVAAVAGFVLGRLLRR
jgi:hypothetical protein